MAHCCYLETGPQLGECGGGGGVEDRHVVVERCLVFPCLLELLHGHGPPPSGLHRGQPRGPFQHVLYRACTGVNLGASASLDGEEAGELFLAWEELGPLLTCAHEDGEWQALAAMRDLARDLYSDTPPRVDLRAAEVPRAHRLHCCKAACQSNYLLYLEEDATLVLANTGNGASNEYRK